MSSMDLLDVGQANEFKLACRRNNFTPEDLKWLCEGDNLANVQLVRLGQAILTIPDHLIDLDADPFIPSEWKVEEHRKGGAFKWDAAKVKLYLSKGQQGRKCIGGDKLREELKNKPIYNANLLDFFLKNSHLIPVKWKGTYIYFWGTIYRNPKGDLVARNLYWNGIGWDWGYGWLKNNNWHNNNPAAVLAS